MANGDFGCKSPYPFHFLSLLHSLKPFKATQLTSNLLDIGANVVIWGFAESLISIIAASIPILRAFIQYGTGSGPRNQTNGLKTQTASVLKSRNKVDVASNGHMSGVRQRVTDKGREKSILGSDINGEFQKGEAGGIGIITLRTKTKV
jgi:hypothetical protein